MIKLAIAGAQGRMGQNIMEATKFHTDTIDLKVLLENPKRSDLLKEMNGVKVSTDLAALKGCDVLIDFTIPEATYKNIDACLDYKVGMVIGTTGLEPLHIRAIENASKHIPIVYSSNMSLGVNVFFSLIEKTAKIMQGGFDRIIIDETHHVHKKDKPSGTAKTMREYAELNSGLRMAEADMISKRTGEVIGDHTIIFETPFDTITITHHAKSRMMFAIGAVSAAKWLVENKKKKGLYNMKDVFGLK